MAGLMENRLGIAQRIGAFERNTYDAGIQVARVLWDREGRSGLTIERSLDFTLMQAPQGGFLLIEHSGAHGKESTSVMKVKRTTHVAADKLKCGTYLSLSEANPEGIFHETREVPYMGHTGSSADLNRAYTFLPDASNGVLTRVQRHAKTIIDRFHGAYKANEWFIKHKPSHLPPFPGLLIDWHTEDLNAGDSILPYIRIDYTDDDSLLAYMIYCAEVAGIPYAMEPPNTEMNDSLTAEAVRRHMAALTVELGPAGAVDPFYVEVGERMTARLMNHFGMIATQKAMYDNWLHRDMQEKIKKVKDIGPLQLVDGYCMGVFGKISTAEGILEFSIRPGQSVKKGDQIGVVMPRVPRPVGIPVYAKEDCVVLSVPGSSVLNYQARAVAFQAAKQSQDPRILRLTKAVQQLLQNTSRGV